MKDYVMMTTNFENVNHLVLNFYPDGYSIAVKLNEFPVFTSETILETARISYEETSLLDYIENEELPPLLVEMIDSSPKLSQYKIWHNGCLILEVRDKMDVITNDEDDGDNYNQSGYKLSNKRRKLTHDFYNFNDGEREHQAFGQFDDNNQSIQPSDFQQTYLPFNDGTDPPWKMEDCFTNLNLDLDDVCLENPDTPEKLSNSNNSYFMMLKPTNLSMLNDVINLTESNSWSPQDRLQLESQIVLHNSPILFLDPLATDEPSGEEMEWPDNMSKHIYTRHKKILPHTKLMEKKVSISDANRCNNHSNGKRYDYSSQQTSINNLPPELTLQHFLATKRAQKKPSPAEFLAKFHRFKKNLTNTRNLL